MKVIDANYNVRVGYWASRNNVQKYKVYVIVIQMFDLDFVNNLQQFPRNNPWLAKLTNCNYKTCLLHQEKNLLGINKVDQYSLVEASNKKWPENESDLEDDEYELPI